MSSLISSLKIGTKIGNGHFGDVFLAEDEVHGKVAVKVLQRASGESDSGWAQRKVGLLAEAQLLAKARHPNVVPVYHIVEADDGESILFCMAFCEGGSLLSAFKNGPMMLTAVRRVGMEVLLGLQSLHHIPMLHRDIKPGNILLNAHGTAQLADFGLVTDELILGYGSIAGYSDHIAIEVWTGLVQKGGFASTLKWLPHVPNRWRRVLRKMMNDDTSARYQSADQVLSAISKLPVDLEWECEVSPARIQWVRTAKSRKIIVQWDRLAPRRHEWKAWSEPLGKGRKATLGGSQGQIIKSQVIKDLEDFFEV